MKSIRSHPEGVIASHLLRKWRKIYELDFGLKSDSKLFFVVFSIILQCQRWVFVHGLVLTGKH